MEDKKRVRQTSRQAGQPRHVHPKDNTQLKPGSSTAKDDRYITLTTQPGKKERTLLIPPSCYILRFVHPEEKTKDTSQSYTTTLPSLPAPALRQQQTQVAASKGRGGRDKTTTNRQEKKMTREKRKQRSKIYKNGMVFPTPVTPRPHIQKRTNKPPGF